MRDCSTIHIQLYACWAYLQLHRGVIRKLLVENLQVRQSVNIYVILHEKELQDKKKEH